MRVHPVAMVGTALTPHRGRQQVRASARAARGGHPVASRGVGDPDGPSSRLPNGRFARLGCGDPVKHTAQVWLRAGCAR